MRRAFIIAVVAFPVAPAAGKSVAATTWAKTGVSYDRYRGDSVECAYAGYYRDISRDEPAVRFLTGWRAGDVALNTPGGNGDTWGAAIARTQPDRRIAEILALQTANVRDCLVRKGYAEVALTRSEARQLSGLRKGSEARRRFLYLLATR